ncbi:hypothetical protein NQ318_013325 [Aromia moschata]|uniref:Uncharacterized protein n=1 Tax=Aromia moschata TaxID=1265417 RepID=A0AAV8XZJ3_9CUCU|nr:hypothetical protein NQ318_013325 [Aromia moschata]
MPPKVGTKHSTVKSKTHVSNGKSSTERSSSSTPTLSSELEQQFEIELCWCIQQLQIALKSGKLNNKQAHDHTKALNTLMSNSSTMVKKRQVMRLSFGDYRAKMTEEDKKRSQNALRMTVKPAEPNKKTVFIKKSAFVCSNENTFKFNFACADDSSTNDTILNTAVKHMNSFNDNKNQDLTKNAHFVPSDNSFRFNFDPSETS